VSPALLKNVDGSSVGFICLLFFFFFEVLGFELRAYTLSHYHQPIFVMGFFQGRVSQAICLGWL
jgi:hypothetical protein